MKLHQDKKLFSQAVRATAQNLKIPEIYIEKDYWVTLILKELFASEVGSETIFKGGTALSKCFQAIQRFSEDVDLVMMRKESDSNASMERKVKKPSKIIGTALPEVHVEGLTNKKGMLRKTAHTYNKAFKGDFGQVRDVIVLEVSSLGRYEPYHKQVITSYIGDMMKGNNQKELISKYEMDPFEVQVLHVNRTLCEKIMSLVRFSYGEEPIGQLKNKIRHVYDIHQLLQIAEINAFFHSSDFEVLLKNVKEDDRLSFKTNTEWLDKPIGNAEIFHNPEAIWMALAPTFYDEFSKLLYGKMPEKDEITKTLYGLSKRMKSLKF